MTFTFLITYYANYTKAASAKIAHYHHDVPHTESFTLQYQKIFQIS